MGEREEERGKMGNWLLKEMRRVLFDLLAEIGVAAIVWKKLKM
jgi:hypothetical protein